MLSYGLQAAQGSRRSQHYCYFHSTALLRSKEEPLAPRVLSLPRDFPPAGNGLKCRKRSDTMNSQQSGLSTGQGPSSKLSVKRDDRDLLIYEVGGNWSQLLSSIIHDSFEPEVMSF